MFFQAVYPCVYRERKVAADMYPFKFGLSLCVQGMFLYLTGIVLFSTVYPCVYRECFIYSTKTDFKNGLSLCVQGMYQL